MTIETSTFDVLLGTSLGAIIALQAWIIHTLFRLKTKVSLVIAVCKLCHNNKELDTDQITKNTK